MRAAMYGHGAVVDALLRDGAAINFQNQVRHTTSLPLDWLIDMEFIRYTHYVGTVFLYFD